MKKIIYIEENDLTPFYKSTAPEHVKIEHVKSHVMQEVFSADVVVFYDTINDKPYVLKDRG